MRRVIIDSKMSRAKALAQNPHSPAPEDLLLHLDCQEVMYSGFDGRLHLGQVVMHESRMQDVLEFFALARSHSFPIGKVVPISNPRYAWSDELSCADNNSSGYNYREIAGKPGKLSKHALGVAFDINPMQNPCITIDARGYATSYTPSTGKYDPRVRGTLTGSHPLVVFMKSRGWEWGGDWEEYGLYDYHHFEKPL